MLNTKLNVKFVYVCLDNVVKKKYVKMLQGVVLANLNLVLIDNI